MRKSIALVCELFLFLGPVLAPGMARGQCESPGTCYSTTAYNAPNVIKKFRVNVDSFVAYIPMLGGDIPTIVASIMGGDVWNEQGNGGHFRYMGTTTLTNIPDTYLGCLFYYPSFESIIVAVNAEADHASYAEPKCGGYAEVPYLKTTPNPRWSATGRAFPMPGLVLGVKR